MKALGMIEVYGYVTAVEALDSALKAANVNLINVTLVKGGLVTVLVTGDVGATKAAMDASKTAAERIGKVISVHVIPRPSDEIMKIVPPPTENTLVPVKKQDKITPFTNSEPKSEISGQSEPDVKLLITDSTEIPDTKETKEGSENEADKAQVDIKEITPELLESMTVEKLRKLARDIKITNMTHKQIRFGTKKELIRSISAFLEQER